jgi:hypothetical protein
LVQSACVFKTGLRLPVSHRTTGSCFLSQSIHPAGSRPGA